MYPFIGDLLSSTILLWVPVAWMIQKPLFTAYLRIKTWNKPTQNKAKMWHVLQRRSLPCWVPGAYELVKKIRNEWTSRKQWVEGYMRSTWVTWLVSSKTGTNWVAYANMVGQQVGKMNSRTWKSGQCGRIHRTWKHSKSWAYEKVTSIPNGPVFKQGRILTFSPKTTEGISHLQTKVSEMVNLKRER